MSSCWVVIACTLLYLGVILAGAFLPCPEEPEERRPLPSFLWEDQ